MSITNLPMTKIGCRRSPPDDVATGLASMAVAMPVNRIVELSGPEPLALDELVRRFLGAAEGRHLWRRSCAA
jgi:hypothetical protein